MPTHILQLRIELLLIERLIWRRLQVPGDDTFWDLHVAIQSAFGWSDTHLHEFRPWGHRDGGSRFGIPIPEDPDHASSHAWAASQKGRRGKFDPEAFDEQQVKFANPAPRLKRLLAHFASRR